MRRSAAFALLLTGCLYFEEDDVNHVPEPMPEPVPPVLPEGVWEPYPDANIVDANVAVDGNTLWWATSRRITDPVQYINETAVWLHATGSDGAIRVEPRRVAAEVAVWSPDVLVTPTAIYAKGRNDDIVVRPFSRAGEPLGEHHVVPFPLSPSILYTPMDVALTATPTGTAKVVLPLYHENADVAIVSLDESGAPTTTTLAGTPATDEGGTDPSFVSAATRSDGTTLVAWDRQYNGCISSKPGQALATTIGTGGVAPIATLGDGTGESHPVVAARGNSAFVTWQHMTVYGPRIAIAALPDTATVLGDVEGPKHYEEHALALASETRGAVATRTGEGTIVVTPFELDSGLSLGAPIEVPLVSPDDFNEVVGFVHLADDRYLVAWIEHTELDAIGHLYATEVVAVPSTMRPAPPVTPPVAAPPSRLRCP